MSHFVCIRASPEVRKVCPTKFIEGWWEELPDHIDTVVIKTPSNTRELEVFPTGVMESNSHGQVAEVYEIRWSNYDTA